MKCPDPHAILDFLKENATERKLRLFACACCRRVWDLLTDEQSRQAVEITEHSVDGLATAEARGRAGFDLLGSATGVTAPANAATDHDAALGAHRSAQASATAAASRHGTDSMKPNWQQARQDETETQSAFLRDIFGHIGMPCCSVDPYWLTWHDATIPKLAQAAYDERELPSGHLDTKRLAILADALEESGCTNEDVLAHLRGAGPHVRGCWVVDLLLGRE